MKMTSNPFKLVGMELEDYLKWCLVHNLKNYDNKNKKQFIKMVLNKNINKNAEGELYEFKNKI